MKKGNRRRWERSKDIFIFLPPSSSSLNISEEPFHHSLIEYKNKPVLSFFYPSFLYWCQTPIILLWNTYLCIHILSFLPFNNSQEWSEFICCLSEKKVTRNLDNSHIMPQKMKAEYNQVQFFLLHQLHHHSIEEASCSDEKMGKKNVSDTQYSTSTRTTFLPS